MRDSEITDMQRERAATPDPHRAQCPTCGAVPGAECTGGGERAMVSNRVRGGATPRLVHGPRMERAQRGVLAADATTGYLLDLLLEDTRDRNRRGTWDHVTHRDGSRSQIEVFFILNGYRSDGRPQVWGWRVVQLARVGSQYTTCGAVRLEHGLASNEHDAMAMGRKRAIALAKERRAASKRPDLPLTIHPSTSRRTP